MKFLFKRQGAVENTPKDSAAGMLPPSADLAHGEAQKRLARLRFIGAAVLVLVGVLVFSFLLDHEPRPVAGDLPIVVQSKPSAAPATAAFSDVSIKDAVKTKAEPKIETKPASVAAPVAAVSKPEPPAEPMRYVVHIGSYLIAEEAAKVRAKAMAAGIDTFTQTLDTSKGKFTRVRVGPFNRKDEAQKYLKKAHAAGLAKAELMTL